jgi:hypothetical protein
MGRASEAAALALERQKLWPDHGVELYNVACQLILCAALVGEGKVDPTSKEKP